MRLVFSVIACLTLAACITSPKQCEFRPSDPATETFSPSLGVDIGSMTRTVLGDYTQDDVVGGGSSLIGVDIVSIHYWAYLANGTPVDSVMDQPFTIDLRTQSTIGLADGMIGMNVGGSRTIVVPSELALGACDNGSVPGNSTLVYKVDLLSIGAP
jgi:FKBP-type peptidyl-prolyl cis-trans isomerase FkpA